MVEQEHVVLLTLSEEETKNLKDGINLITKSEDQKYIIFKDADKQELKVCRNKCKHQGGTFIKDIEDGPDTWWVVEDGLWDEALNMFGIAWF